MQTHPVAGMALRTDPIGPQRSPPLGKRFPAGAWRTLSAGLQALGLHHAAGGNAQLLERGAIRLSYRERAGPGNAVRVTSKGRHIIGG
jgi:hypothetical protein